MKARLATKGRSEVIPRFFGHGLAIKGRLVFSSLNSHFYDLFMAIQTAVNTIANGILPVHYDNAPFDRPVDLPWARLTILTGESIRADLGSLNIRYRNPGIAIFSVFTPISIGMQKSNELVDYLAGQFRSITSNRVTFRTPDVKYIGREGNEWQTNIICPFFSDHFHVRK